MSFTQEAVSELTKQEARNGCKSEQIGIGVEGQHGYKLFSLWIYNIWVW
jgi:hypothetical protein